MKGFKEIGIKKIVLAVMGVALGATLMLAGNFGGNKSESRTEEEDATRAEVYRVQTEDRVRALCESVKGVDGVRVMVTLSGGYRTEYAEDARGECLTVGSGSSERAVIRSVGAPEIVGVGIVCRGAEDPEIQKTLTELVASSLGIGANRVVITDGK